MPDTDTLEREAPPEEENQEDSPPQEESDDDQKKSQRPSLRSARRAGKLGKGFGGSGAAVGGGATAGSAGIAGGAAAGGSTAAAAGGGAAIVGGGWIILIVALVVLLILIVILIATGGGDWENQQRQNTTTPLKISKTGPSDAVKDEVLNYQINVSYAGTAQDVEVTDKIPDGTSYDKSDPSGKYDEATRTVTWNLKDYQASPGAILNNVNMAINLTLKATVDNAYLVNQASGTVIGAGANQNGPVSGDIAKLLPNPLPSDPEGVQDMRNTAMEAIKPNRDVYEKSAAATGVPWQVFAGIHYREGGAATGTSLVSGRPIGGNEPDVVAGPGCSSEAPQGVDDGIPEPFSGGCKFASMLDSGIYGGNLLKGKVGENLNTFEDLVKALSRYNGGGNSNCGKGVPYNGCPRLFEGEDDPYALNFFDAKHKPMYVIYCADYTKCNPPVEDGRPGTATVTKWAAQNTSELVYAFIIN
jgi:hypothetical protein